MRGPREPLLVDNGVTCRNCGERIVQLRYGFGPVWTHQPAGASFQDSMHRFCHNTVAEPAEDASIPSGADQ